MPRQKPSTTALSVSITRNWQITFIAAVLLMWLSPLVYLAFWMSSSYISSGSLWYQLSTVAVGVAWFAGALWWSWNRYRTLLQRIFSAMFVVTIFAAIYGVMSTIETMLRFRYFPPAITYENDSGLLTAFGHEWLVMIIGVVLLYLALFIHKQRAAKK